MLWYPILPAGLHEGLRARLEAAHLPDMITHEVDMPPHWEKGLRGSGVIIANPPYGMADNLSGPPWPFATTRLLGRPGPRKSPTPKQKRAQMFGPLPLQFCSPFS